MGQKIWSSYGCTGWTASDSLVSILTSKNLSCGKELTHSHTMTHFDAPGKQPFENTMGKGEIARNEQFLLYPQCFLTL